MKKKRIEVGVKIDNLITTLNSPIPKNSAAEPIYLDSREGSKIYRHTFCFVISMAAKELFPDRRLIIGNTIGSSFTFYFDGINDMSEVELEALNNKLKEIIDKNEPITSREISYQAAEKLFKENSMIGASQLLMTINDPFVKISECRGYSDIAHNTLYPSTGILKYYNLLSYKGGFVVQFPK